MVRFPRVPICPAAGGGPHFPLAHKSIRLARYGCANRPFYHIVVNMVRRHQHEQPIEQLGTYDPLPNKYNEKLVSINIERLRYWLAHRTSLSVPVGELLGLCGLLPIHAHTYIRAYKRRLEALKRLEQETAKEDKEANGNEKANTESSAS